MAEKLNAIFALVAHKVLVPLMYFDEIIAAILATETSVF